MALSFSPEPLARRSARRPWITLGLWVVGILVALFLWGAFFEDVVTTKFEFINSPEPQRGLDLLEQELRGPRGTNEVIIIQSESMTVDEPAFRGFVEEVHSDLEALGPDVIKEGTLVNYYLSGDESLVSEDRNITIIPFVMAGNYDDSTDNITQVLDLVDGTAAPAGLEMLITGQATVADDFNRVSEEDLLRGERFGIPIALLILVLVLGALVAAVVPVVIAFASIFVAFGIATLVGQVFELSFFVTNMIFMIGLAVGIDYSLFVVARYREERTKGLEKVDAIAKAGGTAGRTVLFSGTTVVLALIGMLLVPFNVYIGLGLGAIFVVIAAVLASMTLLPAVLGLLGDGVNRLAIPFVGRVQARYDEARPGGFWDRMARTVMRQPVVFLVVVSGILIAAAVPTLDLNIGFAGVSTIPDDLRSKEGFVILDREFSAGQVTPAEIVIEGDIDSPEVQGALQRLRDLLAADPEGSFGTPRELEVNARGDVAVLPVPVAGDSAGPEAHAAVDRLQDEYVPQAFAGVAARTSVTGETAYSSAFFDTVKDMAPVVFGFVLAISFILLTLVFRSIVIPLKAIILNLLSVGATYGILVLIFQKGWLADQLGFQESPIVEAWIPLFLFAVLFGLSMDYHVFLLSRIRERFDQTGDNTSSVAFGIRSTGRLISGAALIMVAVFWGFAAGDLVGLQQMGFGLGLAVLLDATVIRIILVPATMRLLGKWNWYLPRWLNWLPDFRVEVEGDRRAPAPAD